jgi:hypothetical protein
MLKPARGTHSNQARLLDRFTAALRRNRRAARPPAELDPELARMAAYVELEIEPRLPDPHDAFAGALWRRISATTEPADDHVWRGPAVDLTRLRPPVPIEDDDASVPVTHTSRSLNATASSVAAGFVKHCGRRQRCWHSSSWADS